MVIPSEMEQVVIAGKHLDEGDGDLTFKINDVIVSDFMGTGVNLVASRSMR